MTGVQNLLQNAANVISTDSKGLSGTVQATARLMMAAWAVMIIGGTMAGFALVYALAALIPGAPIWSWFVLVGLVAFMAGAWLMASGRTRLDSLGPLREHSAEVAIEAVLVAEQINEAINTTSASFQKSVGAVASTVESVRTAADLRYQVEQRPWLMLAGAAGLGYAGGVFLNTASLRSTDSSHARPENGNGSAPSASRADTGTGASGARTPRDEPGILAQLGAALAPQAELARAIAIGALFSLARDYAHNAVPIPMTQPVDDFFNDAATRFGGRPLAPGHFKAFAARTSAEGARPVA